MEEGKKETITTRLVSTLFVVTALAVFKPFGLGAWHWQAYGHLLAIWVLGLVVVMLTEAVMRYVVQMPRSMERGVAYIIRRNLWFQCINTPLVALMICLYRHFVLSNLIPSNRLSWGNYLETLVIIAFCSFAIGLYWRFKYRSRYLAMELEEIRQLNEQLGKPALTPSPVEESPITLTGTTNDTVTLNVRDLLYVEAVGNYVKVCHLRDRQVRTDMLRATSRQMEDELEVCPTIVRCHRAFLVNLSQVEQIVSRSGMMQLRIRHCADVLPVSRSRMAQVKAAIAHYATI